MRPLIAFFVFLILVVSSSFAHAGCRNGLSTMDELEKHYATLKRPQSRSLFSIALRENMHYLLENFHSYLTNTSKAEIARIAKDFIAREAQVRILDEDLESEFGKYQMQIKIKDARYMQTIDASGFALPVIQQYYDFSLKLIVTLLVIDQLAREIPEELIEVPDDFTNALMLMRTYNGPQKIRVILFEGMGSILNSFYSLAGSLNWESEAALREGLVELLQPKETQPSVVAEQARLLVFGYLAPKVSRGGYFKNSLQRTENGLELSREYTDFLRQRKGREIKDLNARGIIGHKMGTGCPFARCREQGEANGIDIMAEAFLEIFKEVEKAFIEQ